MQGQRTTLSTFINPRERHYSFSVSQMNSSEYTQTFDLQPLYQELFKLYLSEQIKNHQKDSEELFEFMLQKLIETNKFDFYSLKYYALIRANHFHRNGFLMTLKSVFFHSKSKTLLFFRFF